MMRYGIRLTFLLLALALVVPASQFAQESSKTREVPDSQSSLHSLMVGLVRAINTAEATYHIQHRAYASWETLLEKRDEQQYLNGWLTQFYPRYYPQARKANFSTPPEVLPGLNLRMSVAPDGRSYVVLVEDGNDKTGFAFVSDERGVIRYCQYIQ